MLRSGRRAFTVVELLIIVAILGTLTALAVPGFASLINRARVNQAVSDISLISAKIEDFMIEKGYLPDSLAEIPQIKLTDPWGNTYQYLKIFGKSKGEVAGRWRMDRFLVPLNTDFDLYSKGKDEASFPPLTAKQSFDDIIRAHNGEYIGLGSRF